MASSINTKLNLPNVAGGQNQNNLVSEYDEYVKIYKNWNRTTTGHCTIGPLASSGKTYSTKDYPEDSDVYNRGQEGMLSLLYKYVLKNYLVDVDALKELSSAANTAMNKAENAEAVANAMRSEIGNCLITYDVLVSNSPANCVAGNSIRLSSSGSIIPIKMINAKPVGAGTWAKDAIVQLAINNSGDTLTATLSGGGGGSGGFVISTTAPSDTTLMWIDSANGYFAKVWDGSAWVGISAAWG